MALNEANTIAPDRPGPAPASTNSSTQRRALFGGRQRRLPLGEGEISLYQHSNLFYWWVVWAYGFACAAITYVQGTGIEQLATKSADGDQKVILFHPSPWLGLSFIGLVLFVIVFTNVRARGVYSFVLLLLAGAIVWATRKIPGIDTAFGWVSLLRVHLNLAFYLTFSLLLMLIWLFVTVFVDHFSWWRFSPGQVIEEHWIGQATGHAYNTEGMIIRRLPDDLFRHRVLGFGTGDFVVKPAAGDPFEIHNVWRANIKQRRLERMIAIRSIAGLSNLEAATKARE